MGTIRSKVSIGTTSIVGWLTALLGLAPIAAKAVQEGAGITVSGPERWLAIAGVAALFVTNGGRYLQAALGKVSPKINIGISTVIGWAVAFAGLLPILTQSYGEGLQALHSPEKYAAIAGVVSLLTTQLGRYLQSLRL